MYFPIPGLFLQPLTRTCVSRWATQPDLGGASKTRSRRYHWKPAPLRALRCKRGPREPDWINAIAVARYTSEPLDNVNSIFERMIGGKIDGRIVMELN